MQKQVKPYSSAEFQLEVPGIFYQFKLRKNKAEPLFVLVKQDSKALARFKAGAVIPMTYYFQDKTIPSEKRQTRIKYIVDGKTIGINNHIMIALDISMNWQNPDMT